MGGQQPAQHHIQILSVAIDVMTAQRGLQKAHAKAGTMSRGEWHDDQSDLHRGVGHPLVVNTRRWTMDDGRWTI